MVLRETFKIHVSPRSRKIYLFPISLELDDGKSQASLVQGISSMTFTVEALIHTDAFFRYKFSIGFLAIGVAITLKISPG